MGRTPTGSMLVSTCQPRFRTSSARCVWSLDETQSHLVSSQNTDIGHNAKGSIDQLLKLAPCVVDRGGSQAHGWPRTRPYVAVRAAGVVAMDSSGTMAQRHNRRPHHWRSSWHQMLARS